MSDIHARLMAFLKVATDLKQKDKDTVIFPKDPQGWVTTLREQVDDGGDLTVRVETLNDGDGHTFVSFCSDKSIDDFEKFVYAGGGFSLILTAESLRKLGEMFLFAAEHNPKIGE